MHGEFAITMRVRGVIAFSTVRGAQTEIVVRARGDEHGLAARVFHDVGIAHPIGRGDHRLRRPELISEHTALKMACLPPTVTMHSAG